MKFRQSGYTRCGFKKRVNQQAAGEVVEDQL
jgi:hypothetical protein